MWSNDADKLEDGALLSGSRGDRFHKASYFQVDAYHRSNITAAITSGNWETRMAAPGGTETFGAEIRRTRAGRRGFKGIVRAKSLLDEAKRDEVKLQTRGR